MVGRFFPGALLAFIATAALAQVSPGGSVGPGPLPGAGLAQTQTFTGVNSFLPTSVASPAGVTEQFAPSVITGTSNTAGADTTLNLSQGTGTGISGKLLIKGAPHSTTGSTPNALATQFTFDGDTGRLVVATADTAKATYCFTNAGACNEGMSSPSANAVYLWANGGVALYFNNSALKLRSDGAVLFTSSTSLTTASAADGALCRASSGVLEIGATGCGAGGSLLLAGLTASGAIINTGITADTAHTDSSVCQDTTSHQFYSGTGTLGICLGTSSARFKHDIAPLTYGLAAIMALQPVSYRLNADHGDPTKTLLGFTAEQMRPVVPELVGLDGAGRPNTADYVGLIPVLVKAVQEQQAEIEALKARVANGDAQLDVAREVGAVGPGLLAHAPACSDVSTNMRSGCPHYGNNALPHQLRGGAEGRLRSYGDN